MALEATDGGALRHIQTLCSHLDKNRFDITVVFSTLRNDRVFHTIAQLKKRNIKVVILQMVRNINPLQDTLSFIKIYRLLKKNRFDIVHAHSSKAGLLFRLAAHMLGVGFIIYTPHCFYFQGKKGIIKDIFSTIEKWLSYISDAIIVCNQEKVSALAAGIQGKKLVHINNAIDKSCYQQFNNKQLLRDKYNIPPYTIVIGTVGRLEPQKNYSLLLSIAKETIRQTKNVCFIIAGDGKEKRKLEQQICRLGLSDYVRLVGYVDNIDEIYSITDIFLNSAKWEGLPYSFLEAARFQIPILTSVPSDFNNCLKENPKEVTRIILIKELLQLIQQPVLLHKLGSTQHMITNHQHTLAGFIDRHQQLYSSHYAIIPFSQSGEDAVGSCSAIRLPSGSLTINSSIPR